MFVVIASTFSLFFFGVLDLPEGMIAYTVSGIILGPASIIVSELMLKKWPVRSSV